MAITYSFIDSVTYGTDDINDITRSLVGAGVAPFLSKDSYNTSDLNVMTSALVGEGVQLGGCEVSIQNAATQEMIATVAQGIIFFESGVRLTVDSDGYTLSVVPNTKGYVFAHHNTALQTAEILFAAELPTDGEYVLLAEVSSVGKVTDKRRFAESKVATLGKNAIKTTRFTYLREPEFVREYNITEFGTYLLGETEVVDTSKFNYAIIGNNLFRDKFWILSLDGNSIGGTGGTLYSDAYGHIAYRVENNKICIHAIYMSEKLKYLKQITNNPTHYMGDPEITFL